MQASNNDWRVDQAEQEATHRSREFVQICKTNTQPFTCSAQYWTNGGKGDETSDEQRQQWCQHEVDSALETLMEELLNRCENP